MKRLTFTVINVQEIYQPYFHESLVVELTTAYTGFRLPYVTIIGHFLRGLAAINLQLILYFLLVIVVIVLVLMY